MTLPRILIIAERFYPEEFGINDLALDWKKRGYDVTVLTQVPSYPFDQVFDGYKNSLIQKQDWSGITIYRVWTLCGYKNNVIIKILNYLCFAVLSSLVALFIGRKADKVFIYHVGPLTQAIAGVLVKLIYGKKLLIWTLDVWPDSVYAYGFKKTPVNMFLLENFVKCIYRRCDHVLVSCRGFIERVGRYIDSDLISYSPQWAPIDMDFRHAQPRSELAGYFNFTFAGNIGKVQNLENVILGFSGISAIYPNARLNIIGDGSNLDDLKLLVKNRSIANVVFWGRKPLKEMPEWLLASDVLLISLIDKPIFEITVPAKFQAYLATNKPIFAIIGGEVAGLVASNQIGYTAHPCDQDDIRRGFEQFMKASPDDLTKMVANTKYLLDGDYNYDKILQHKHEILSTT